MMYHFPHGAGRFVAASSIWFYGIYDLARGRGIRSGSLAFIGIDLYLYRLTWGVMLALSVKRSAAAYAPPN